MNDPQGSALSPFERARRVSQALSDAARQARSSSRTRRSLSGGGFSDRRGASAMRLFVTASFWLLFAIPATLGSAYFGLIASDQYIAEAKFTVAGGEPVMPDGLGVLSGIPSVTIIQDTQIVTNYLESRAAVERLEERLNLRALYSLDGVDYFARFNPEKPIERLVRYWRRMIDVSIKMPAGIVEFRVRAFSAQDAQRIAQAAVEISEELINDLNNRMNRDALRSGELELERAQKRLQEARIALERARNEEGILDVGAAIEGIRKLIDESRSSQLKLQQEYQSQLRVVSETAPQMRNLRARIEGISADIARLQAQLATTQQGSNGRETLAGTLTRFSILDLERQIAERLYAGAIATVEIARLTVERKHMYLNVFVSPTLPQEARFPRRGLTIFGVVLGSLTLWGVIVGLVSMARNHMA